jgi:hypothetical protein
MTALAMSGEVRNGTIADFDAGRAGEEFRGEVLRAAGIDRADGFPGLARAAAMMSPIDRSGRSGPR